MKLNNICLSLDQMNTLANLGLDTSDASMAYAEYWTYSLHGFGSKLIQKPVTNQAEEFSVDIEFKGFAYTFLDIIDKLPKKIDFESKDKSYSGPDTSTLEISPKDNSIYYESQHLDDHKNKMTSGENLLEAAYNMLLWCIEKGHVVTTKGESQEILFDVGIDLEDLFRN